MSVERKVLESPKYLFSADDLRRAASMSSDLLPCPFCGRPPISAAHVNTQSGNVVAQIVCGWEKCNLIMSVCLGGLETEARARAEVKQKWNSRVVLANGEPPEGGTPNEEVV